MPLLKTSLDQLTSYAGWSYRYRRRARPAANPRHQWGYSGLLGGVARQEQVRLKLRQEESASENRERSTYQEKALERLWQNDIAARNYHRSLYHAQALIGLYQKRLLAR